MVKRLCSNRSCMGWMVSLNYFGFSFLTFLSHSFGKTSNGFYLIKQAADLTFFFCKTLKHFCTMMHNCNNRKPRLNTAPAQMSHNKSILFTLAAYDVIQHLVSRSCFCFCIIFLSFVAYLSLPAGLLLSHVLSFMAKKKTVNCDESIR